MDRKNLERVNVLMGKLRRLEAGVKAIVHQDGDSYLHVRNGNTDLETGIQLSRNHVLHALRYDINDTWKLLIELDMKRSPSTDLVLAEYLDKLDRGEYGKSKRET
jgi:hypothetical protein